MIWLLKFLVLALWLWPEASVAALLVQESAGAQAGSSAAAGVAEDQPKTADSPPGPVVPAGWSVEPLSVKTLEVSAESLQENGEDIQRFRFLNTGPHQMVMVSSPRPGSRLHDEFRATVRLHSTCAGIQLALRVVLPHQPDPRTNRPLTTLITGSVYRRDGNWQVLSVSGTSAALEAQLRRVRAELHRSDINARNAYINGLALLIEAAPGETFLDVAASEYGPVVSDSGLPSAALQPLTTVSSQETVPEPPRYVPLQVELNHVLLQARPAVLRFAPDHGETIPVLQQLGLNAAWIPDCRDQERADLLSAAGLAVLATPPQPVFEPGNYTKMLQALPPLDQLCPGVSAWLLGTRVTPDQLPHFLALSRETRSADRRLRRPQLADVTAAEGAASREIELVGIGKHVVGRDDTFGQLRNQLFRRQRVAGQLSFPWIWVQTEPSSQQRLWRQQTAAVLPHVEPEQILCQVSAAMSAGCKGVGYWKTRSLQGDNELDQETLLAIELANLELSLLEPFLANGRVDGHLLMQTGSEDPAAAVRRSRSQPWIRSALNSSRLSTSAMVQEEPDGPDATVITSGGSMLILVNHWDRTSQYVPAPMYARELSLVVSASETASAWQLTTTGVRALRQEVMAGGLKLRIQDFDRYAAILVSSDPELIRTLEQSIYQMAERSARLTLELASLKYRRVLATTEELREFGAVPTDVSRLFTSARQSLDRAQHEASQQDFNEASLFGRQALRVLRQIQQLCWNEAVRGLISPSAAPHTIAFSTLPEHWAMLEELQARSGNETDSLLPAGSFENLQLLSENGWQRAEAEASGYSCTADVITEPASGNSVLRLAAWVPGSQQTATSRRDTVTPLVVTSPAVAVQGGDLVRITGRLRKGRVVPPQSRQPVLLFDSELGPECGVRMAVDTEWQTFEILRQIAPTSTSLQFSVALTAVAEVHIDDVSITRLPARPEPGFQGPLQLTGQRRTSGAAETPAAARAVTEAAAAGAGSAAPNTAGGRPGSDN